MSTNQATFDTLNLDEKDETDRENAPTTIAYADIETEEDLIKYSEQYASRAITQYDIDVNQARITHWEVSQRAKRRAAAVMSANIQKSTTSRGIRTHIGKHINWDDLIDTTNINAKVQRSSKLPFDDVRNVGMTLTWRAFEAFDETEWQRTIRHELIHVEQYQKYGESNHGRRFKNRAEELDADGQCPKFHTGKYLLTCSDCGDVVADRTKRSKYVKMADPNHPMTNTLTPTNCCDAKITLEDNSN